MPGIFHSLSVLTEANAFLSMAQLQVGYRVRDEVAMFLLHAQKDPAGFGAVDPLDLALNMKVLPRIQGGSGAVREVLQRLLVWSSEAPAKQVTDRAERAEAIVTRWREAGRQDTVADAIYPRTAARLCLMWERLQTDGFTSYWL